MACRLLVVVSMRKRPTVRIPPASLALFGVVAALTAHCSAPQEEEVAASAELVAADGGGTDARPPTTDAATSDAAKTDASTQPQPSDAGAKTDARPKPPDPDPDPDPEKDAGPCEACTAQPSHFELPPLSKSWGQSIPAEWLGPEQTIGWNLRLEVEGSSTTDECACDWSHEYSGAATGSVQFGKKGFNANASFLDAKTTCQTPVCPPGGKHACGQPSGVDETSEWSFGAGGQIQLPVPGPLMVVCKSKLIQCQIHGRFTVEGGTKTETGSGEAACAPCGDGKARQLRTVNVSGSVAGGMEAELVIPWVGNVQVGMELQAGARYRSKKGDDCGTGVNDEKRCAWAIGRAYVTACSWGVCIDKEAEIGYGFDCRRNVL